MIDPNAALLTYLREDSDLTDVLGGDFVFTPELPEDRLGSERSLVFRVGGGRSGPYPRAQDLRVTFRCYGGSSEDAYEVYAALYDRLHDRQNFVVGDVGFWGADEDVPGEALEDNQTGWPFIHTVYTVKVATIPVAGGNGGS